MLRFGKKAKKPCKLIMIAVKKVFLSIEMSKTRNSYLTFLPYRATLPQAVDATKRRRSDRALGRPFTATTRTMKVAALWLQKRKRRKRRRKSTIRDR